MSELLNKISSYHVFNYLLPGIVFVALAERVVPFSVGQHDVLTMAFLYYFLGLAISRFGSLVVEPLLKLVQFVRFEGYGGFVSASRTDPKLEVLSETNNTYRTLTSMFVLLLLLELFIGLENEFHHFRLNHLKLLTFALLILFLVSYRKQTAYIVKRIKADLSVPLPTSTEKEELAAKR